jgi:opacity protein-like surface antigen
MIPRLAVFVALLMIASAACAQDTTMPPDQAHRPHFGLDVFVGTPSAADDIFQAVFPGISLRFLYSRNIEFSLDYAFIALEYYYPKSPSGPWVGPVDWSSVPSRFNGLRDSWIFYHTRHYISPLAWYVERLNEGHSPFALRVGAGPVLSLVIPSGSADYYPGLSDAFEKFELDFDVHPGWSVAVGLEYAPWRLLRVGVEYLFIVDSLPDFVENMGHSGLNYVDKAGNLKLFVGLRI